jgi:telomerase reverse transcriptase
MARKRKGLDGISDRPKKTLKTATPKAIRTTAWAEDSPNDVHHTVLSSFYPKVCTLRRFLLDNLPSTSRVRRRKLSSFGTDDGSHILDTCLVGVVNEPSISLKSLRKVEFATFTQSQHRATGAYTGRSLQCCMSEVGSLPIRCTCD